MERLPTDMNRIKITGIIIESAGAYGRRDRAAARHSDGRFVCNFHVKRDRQFPAAWPVGEGGHFDGPSLLPD